MLRRKRKISKKEILEDRETAVSQLILIIIELLFEQFGIIHIN